MKAIYDMMTCAVAGPGFPVMRLYVDDEALMSFGIRQFRAAFPDQKFNVLINCNSHQNPHQERWILDLTAEGNRRFLTLYVSGQTAHLRITRKDRTSVNFRFSWATKELYDHSHVVSSGL